MFKQNADRRSIIGGSIQTTLDGQSCDFRMTEKAAAEGTAQRINRLLFGHNNGEKAKKKEKKAL